MHSGEDERFCFHWIRLTPGVKVEFLIFESEIYFSSPVSIFTAFLFSTSHILECKCHGYSNYLFPFVSKNCKPRNYIFGYPGLRNPSPSLSLILPSPLPWAKPQHKPQRVLAGLLPHELPVTESKLTVYCLILRMTPKPFLCQLASPLSPFLPTPRSTLYALTPSNSFLFLKCIPSGVSTFIHLSAWYFLCSTWKTLIPSGSYLKYYLLFRTSLTPSGRLAPFLSGFLLFFALNIVISIFIALYHNCCMVWSTVIMSHSKTA